MTARELAGSPFSIDCYRRFIAGETTAPTDPDVKTVQWPRAPPSQDVSGVNQDRLMFSIETRVRARAHPPTNRRLHDSPLSVANAHMHTGACIPTQRADNSISSRIA